MSFSFNPLKGITRALGVPDKVRPAINTALQVAFPVYGLANQLATTGLETGFKLAMPAQAPANRSQLTVPSNYGLQPSNFSYQAPSYQAPYYGSGSYDAYSLQPQQSYGVSPWGYSTGSPIYSTTPSPAYSAPSQGRSWEDLTSLAGAALPFFL